MRWPLWRVCLLALVALFVAGVQLTPAFAQDTETEEGAGQDDEGEGQEGLDQGEGEVDEEGSEGQGEPEAETGAGEGETEESAAQTGPPWTYQMARISLALLVLIALGIGWWYYRFVLSRQRGQRGAT